MPPHNKCLCAPPGNGARTTSSEQYSLHSKHDDTTETMWNIMFEMKNKVSLCSIFCLQTSCARVGRTLARLHTETHLLLRALRPAVTGPTFLKNPVRLLPRKCLVTGCHGNSLSAGWGGWWGLGVYGDDFTAATSDQQGPVQTLKQNLQELHV